MKPENEHLSGPGTAEGHSAAAPRGLLAVAALLCKDIRTPPFGETLMLEALSPSKGSVADAYDNALAKSTIGLYKTEAIRDGSPFFRTGPMRTLVDLETITSAWIHCYTTRLLMHRLGRVPPADAEAAYFAANHATAWAASHT
jgi:hypothetical protein